MPISLSYFLPTLIRYSSGNKAHEIRFRLFVVYERDGTDWLTAAAHVSVAR